MHAHANARVFLPVPASAHARVRLHAVGHTRKRGRSRERQCPHTCSLSMRARPCACVGAPACSMMCLRVFECARLEALTHTHTTRCGTCSLLVVRCSCGSIEACNVNARANNLRNFPHVNVHSSADARAVCTLARSGVHVQLDATLGVKRSARRVPIRTVTTAGACTARARSSTRAHTRVSDRRCVHPRAPTRRGCWRAVSTPRAQTPTVLMPRARAHTHTPASLPSRAVPCVLPPPLPCVPRACARPSTLLGTAVVLRCSSFRGQPGSKAHAVRRAKHVHASGRREPALAT